jgi:hypothetical protein
MKGVFRAVTCALLLSAASAHAQINVLPIDWSNFKGAKTIRLSFPESPNNANTKIVLDEQGRVLSEESFSNGNLCSRTSYTYDASGRLVSRDYTAMIDTKKPQSAYRQYRYTADKCEELHISEDGRIIKRIESLLDAKGQKISETHFTEDGTEGDSYAFSYDERGNQTDVLLSRSKNQLAQQNWPDSILTKKNVIRYDEYNNPVAFEVYNVLDKVSSAMAFSYTYDERHNWVKRVTAYTNASGKVTPEYRFELSIEYY